MHWVAGASSSRQEAQKVAVAVRSIGFYGIGTFNIVFTTSCLRLTSQKGHSPKNSELSCITTTVRCTSIL